MANTQPANAPRPRRFDAGVALGAVALLVSCIAAGDEHPDLTSLSLEELLNVEVTSVGKKAQALSDAPAAVFVITREDVRRSGATSIPEALRMVPGVQVARLDAHTWAVSARGFNSRFADKLLVLIDGRTVYTPVFSGVYWEQQDTMLEDIDRIEVIRGPGATLWGANAVNGVINIITRPAAETTGGVAVIGAGSEERGFASVRYGTEFASGGAGRGYIKYADRGASRTVDGDDGGDQWEIGQAGFRVDRETAAGDHLTLQGDSYTSNLQQNLVLASLDPPLYAVAVQDQAETSGWNLLARWARPLSPSSDLNLQVYLDHAERSDAFIGQEYDVFDIEFQHRLKLGQRHDLLWGLGYRRIDDKFEATDTVAFDPATQTIELYSGFVQDDLRIADDLLLTLGSKLEHNDYTGSEIQPNARLSWKLANQETLWLAVSRAVRTPSRADRDVALRNLVVPPNAPPFNSPLPIAVVVRGDPTSESEKLLAYEAGYRFAPTPSSSLDLAVFVNEYDSLRTSETGAPQPTDDPGLLELPLPFANKGSGQAYGLEVASEWHPRDGLRLALAYTFTRLDLHTDADSNDSSNAALQQSTPEHQLSLRTSLNLRADMDLDLWLRYSDTVSARSQQQTPAVTDAFWNLDVRYAWRAKPGVEIAVVAQNLLEKSHPEGAQEIFGAGTDLALQRGIYGSIKLEF